MRHSGMGMVLMSAVVAVPVLVFGGLYYMIQWARRRSQRSVDRGAKDR